MGIRKWLFPYTSHLEEELAAVKLERDALLNRLLHAYSGYELKQPVPSYTDAAAATKSPEGDTVLGKGIRSNVDLMREYEEACLAEAEGITGTTIEAARRRAEEGNQKAADEYDQNILRAKAAAAAESGHREIV